MMVGVRRIAVVLAIARRPLMISLRSLTVGFRTLWRVVERRPYDHAFRVDLTEALARAGELTVVVCFAQAAGLKDWYLVRDDAELAVVLGRIPAAGAWGYSDRIEAYATREFAYRGTAADSLRAIAVGLLQEKGEVLLAERLDGDPRLCDAEATDEVGYIDGWFAAPRKG